MERHVKDIKLLVCIHLTPKAFRMSWSLANIKETAHHPPEETKENVGINRNIASYTYPTDRLRNLSPSTSYNEMPNTE